MKYGVLDQITELGSSGGYLNLSKQIRAQSTAKVIVASFSSLKKLLHW